MDAATTGLKRPLSSSPTSFSVARFATDPTISESHTSTTESTNLSPTPASLTSQSRSEASIRRDTCRDAPRRSAWPRVTGGWKWSARRDAVSTQTLVIKA